MIDKINVVALKSIKNLTVKCSRLNLFVGTNSSGKSTLLQALLLMVQKELNGKYISIGDFREVRNYYMPNSSIRIELCEYNKTKPAWIEFVEDKEKEAYNVRTFMDEMDDMDVIFGDYFDDEQSLFSPEVMGFHYLSCHRIGVNDIYAKNMLNESDFGIDGEYALAYLLKNESEAVVDELVVDNFEVTNSLLEQVNYWLNYIVGTTLSISDLK